MKTVHAFGELVYAIADMHQEDELTSEELLRAPTMESVTINSMQQHC